MRAVLLVHGGAWAIPDILADGSIDGVKKAAKEGFIKLEKSGSAVDAVEAAVRILEDIPVFDAGHGAVLNADGDVELDAIIMNGKTLAAGAVSCVKNISNPVTLARSVMEKTDHVMLTGTGANKFAEKQGIPQVPTEELVTQHARAEWKMYQKYNESVTNLFNTQMVHDTVGAVAVDYDGNVACATSTGGITNKMVGRVGDTPVIGSGGYADNNIGAVSATGHGESILKVNLSRLVLFHMEQGKSPLEAANTALCYMEDRVTGRGGVIVVNTEGDWAAQFSTNRMAWACVKSRNLFCGLNPGECFKESLI
ncbi:isoaspartyl peptidase/L-asparaginase-like [Protopterus annectens]|uniref:isoaspartyl peptidase/L-asparaginase-like n=1 Tax=Protopterus annectens TaxID=7888 RepID=UPI001CF9D978|nr:isoaspartyl peptidase/L-asparaginase-like [Protopterus annectens]XP_043919266.1 isoaspartyl peptidase/L-asparaginase-like [Protopterus annectens]